MSNLFQAENPDGDDYNETDDGDGADGELVHVRCTMP